MNKKEFEDYCNKYADKIAVREQVEGKCGSFWLSELSVEVKNFHIERLWNENRMPVRVS